MANAETRLGKHGFVTYRRGEGDEFIVPYNPWMLLDFECHMNVECAASSNCIAYLCVAARVRLCLLLLCITTPARPSAQLQVHLQGRGSRAVRGAEEGRRGEARRDKGVPNR